MSTVRVAKKLEWEDFAPEGSERWSEGVVNGQTVVTIWEPEPGRWETANWVEALFEVSADSLEEAKAEAQRQLDVFVASIAERHVLKFSVDERKDGVYVEWKP